MITLGALHYKKEMDDSAERIAVSDKDKAAGMLNEYMHDNSSYGNTGSLQMISSYRYGSRSS